MIYTYTMQAQKGSDNFKGIYMFETFTKQKTTSGDTLVTVL